MTNDDGFITGELMGLELTDLVTRWGERIQALAAEGADLATLGPVLHQVLIAAADGFVAALPPAVLAGTLGERMILSAVLEVGEGSQARRHRSGGGRFDGRRLRGEDSGDPESLSSRSRRRVMPPERR